MEKKASSCTVTIFIGVAEIIKEDCAMNPLLSIVNLYRCCAL